MIGTNKISRIEFLIWLGHFLLVLKVVFSELDLAIQKCQVALSCTSKIVKEKNN